MVYLQPILPEMSDGCMKAKTKPSCDASISWHNCSSSEKDGLKRYISPSNTCLLAFWLNHSLLKNYGCVWNNTSDSNKDMAEWRTQNEPPPTQRNTAAHPNVQLSRQNIKKLSFTCFMTYHPLGTSSTNLMCSGFHKDCIAIKWKINMKCSNLPSQFPSLQLWMLLTTGNPHQMYAQVYSLDTEKYVLEF